MATIGFVGVGKIGLPMCGNLIKAGHRVVGFRRGSLAEFERLGGIAAHSAAEVGRQADVVFTCLPTDAALEEVIAGEQGLLKSARFGQIVVEFGSHPVAVKESYVAPLAAAGAVFLDGEVSATPGMVAQQKGAIFLGGDEEAANAVEPIARHCVGQVIYFGRFGSATKAKLINNLLVGLHIAGTAQAMAIGLGAGVDVDLLIKAIAAGSGGSMQFGLRAPWMADPVEVGTLARAVSTRNAGSLKMGSRPLLPSEHLRNANSHPRYTTLAQSTLPCTEETSRPRIILFTFSLQLRLKAVRLCLRLRGLPHLRQPPVGGAILADPRSAHDKLIAGG